MGLYSSYRTNENLERKGVVYTPDSSTAITLARAGGSNVKFAKMLEARTKPVRRQIDAGTIDPKLDRRIMAEVFAATVVKNWETLVGTDDEQQLVQGIEADPSAPEGTYTHPIDENGLVPFNNQNVVATLIALPDMFSDMQRESNRAANYQTEQREADGKN